MLAQAEQFIQTLRHELFDHFVIFGTTHLVHFGKVFLEFYHRHRPHQGLDRVPPVRDKAGRQMSDESETFSLANIRCDKQFGGLWKSYRRRVA